MTEVQSTKAEISLVVDRMLAERANSTRRPLLDHWISTLSTVDIASLAYSFDPREVANQYDDDETERIVSSLQRQFDR